MGRRRRDVTVDDDEYVFEESMNMIDEEEKKMDRYNRYMRRHEVTHRNISNSTKYKPSPQKKKTNRRKCMDENEDDTRDIVLFSQDDVDAHRDIYTMLERNRRERVSGTLDKDRYMIQQLNEDEDDNEDNEGMMLDKRIESRSCEDSKKVDRVYPKRMNKLKIIDFPDENERKGNGKKKILRFNLYESFDSNENVIERPNEEIPSYYDDYISSCK